MTAKFDELIIPGLYDSGPDHWQTRWLEARPNALKVELGSWEGPTPEPWIVRLDRAIARRRNPVFLIGHSLGCLAVAWWAQQASADRINKIRGALLVAPPDVDRPDAHHLVRPFAPAPRNALPFPSILVASRTDPYAAYPRLADLASAWGSESWTTPAPARTWAWPSFTTADRMTTPVSIIPSPFSQPTAPP